MSAARGQIAAPTPMGPERLAAGLAALGLELSAAAQAKLVAYLGLLAKWNRTYNLTAVRDEQAMVGQHLFDSLAVLPHLPAGRLADVGSGAGLPGVPIAIAEPQRPVALIESNQKKAAFQREAKMALGLANLEVVERRVEAFRPPAPFAVVISRAFADLGDFVQLSGHLLAPGGLLAAMKGLHPHEEIARLPEGWSVQATPELRVPEVRGARHLVLLRKR